MRKGSFPSRGAEKTVSSRVDVAGPYTRWHFHATNDDGTPRKPSGYMMHVWFVAPDQLRAAYAMTPPVAEITDYQRSLAN